MNIVHRFWTILILATLILSACQPLPMPAAEHDAGNTAEGEVESGWPILMVEDPTDEDALYAGIDLDTDGWLDCSTQNGFDFDAEGNLLVVDSANSQVRVFDANGQPMTTWGEPGRGPGQFDFKHSRQRCSYGDIAIGPDGSIYVLEMGNLRVQKFDADGNFLLEWGGKGFQEGQFTDPMGIEVNGKSDIYVSDGIRSDVQKFDADGNFLLRFGGTGIDDGKFSKPWYMAVDAEDNLYVVDINTHRVQQFDSDGNFLAAWSTLNPDEETNFPAGIALDGKNVAYVTSMDRNYMRSFDPEGAITATWGEAGIGPDQFHFPYYVAIGDDGMLYVGDLGGARIQRLEAP